MKLIKANLLSFGYPCGLDLEGVKFATDIMAKEINKIYGDHPLSLWVRGSSGAIMSTALACNPLITVDSIIHIKKERESSHFLNQNYKDRNCLLTNVNIIVDDFISSGDTVRAIYKEYQAIVDKPLDMIAVTGHVHKWSVENVQTNYFIAKQFIGFEETSEEVLENHKELSTVS